MPRKRFSPKATEINSKEGFISASPPGGSELPPKAVTSNLREFLDKWDNDPLGFFDEAFLPDAKGNKLRLAKWLNSTAAALVTERRVSIRSCRNAGKTTGLALISLWWVVRRLRSKVVYSATRKDQLYDANWAEIKHWHGRLEPSIRDSLFVTSDKVTVGGTPDNFIVARAANSKNSIASQGAHSDNFLWLMDEAAGIDDAIFDVAFGSMTTPDATMMMTGNPTLTSGWFYRTHMHPQISKNWWTLGVSAFDVQDEPYFRKEWIEEARKTWDEESWQWQAYVLGEFPTAQENAIIPIYKINDATNRKVVQSPGYFPIWGFDPAAGGDKCALAKRHGNILLGKVETWVSKDTQVSIDRIASEFHAAKEEKCPPAAICVDATGMGITIAQVLRRLGLPIISVGFSERAGEQNLYGNKRVEMYFKAGEWFSGPTVRIDFDDQLIEELAAARYILPDAGDGSSKRRGYMMEQKALVKERIGRSPDRADAFCLTFCAPSRERNPGFMASDFPALAGLYSRRRPRRGSWMAM